MNITLFNKQDEIGLILFKLDLIIPTIKFGPEIKFHNNTKERDILLDFPTKFRYFRDIDMIQIDFTIFGTGFQFINQWSY